VTIALSSNALRTADEPSVVVCAIAGDDNPYGELVRRRQGSIRQLFRRLCRDPALADDLTRPTPAAEFSLAAPLAACACAALITWRIARRS
jgi:hypothetical protein